jgi:hypothetical protein
MVKRTPWRGPRAVLAGALAALSLYLLIAYLVLPWAWRRHERRHPALADAPTVTHTADGIPGDPLNIALIGTEEELHRAMLAASWYPADPITLRTSLRIATDVVFKRPFDQAPVSPLFLFGRKEDLAFEKPVGTNPRERHHVRFWRSEEVDDAGRPLWFGAATFDTHVGLSHDTGQITHHIAPDVDDDRNLLIDDLERAGMVADVDWIDDFHTARQGKNGGGDPWHTDGRLAVGLIAPTPNTPATTRSDS